MLIDGSLKGEFGQGAIIAIVSIVMVFVILLLIIVLTEIIAKMIGKDEEKPVIEEAQSTLANTPLDINDEDAIVASLIASIDYRNETKKNIKVLSVREVK